ncbi:MAG: ion transporter, partial [Chloroflexota bacterium]
PFDVMILILSVYVLLALFVEVTFNLSEDVLNILIAVDNIICLVFLADFFIRLSRAENKLQFLKWGWIDLLSSIPTLDMFRYGRMVRVIRILRLLRTVRSLRIIAPYIFRHRAKSSFATVTLLAILLILCASIMILSFEQSATSNITNASDALWWSFVTITTVGYGDIYPTTTEGRIIAAILMLCGVGLFGTFSGLIASWFVDDEDSDTMVLIQALQSDVQALHQRVEELETKLSVQLETQLGSQMAHHMDLYMEQLERLLTNQHDKTNL